MVMELKTIVLPFSLNIMRAMKRKTQIFQNIGNEVTKVCDPRSALSPSRAFYCFIGRTDEIHVMEQSPFQTFPRMPGLQPRCNQRAQQSHRLQSCFQRSMKSVLGRTVNLAVAGSYQGLNIKQQL